MRNDENLLTRFKEILLHNLNCEDMERQNIYVGNFELIDPIEMANH